MGQNRSRFQDPHRPVESIDWNQARDFARHLSEQIPELTFDLPTEAQWEYACRAGTESAVYAGDVTILGDANVPALDPIAWYRRKSGVNYDLKDGDPLAYLNDKQYAFDKAGTRQVKRKLPNPWGLYDTLGNVLEWCRDGQRTYSEQPVVDPEERAEEGATRVVRGGGWISHARHVRAAYRYVNVPGIRGIALGFRCVCVQSSCGASGSPSGASGSREVEGRDRPRRDE
jgi:formylglycine-generating enzyme required for sulfatase activity